MKYTLSYYAKENQPYIKTRKWWEFFKKPELIENPIWVRKVANFESKSEDECLKVFDNEMFKDYIKQTNKEANYLQLERGTADEYYATADGLLYEPATSNLIKYSEFGSPRKSSARVYDPKTETFKEI